MLTLMPKGFLEDQLTEINAGPAGVYCKPAVA
jgi:hypothetical protein